MDEHVSILTTRTEKTKLTVNQQVQKRAVPYQQESSALSLSPLPSFTYDIRSPIVDFNHQLALTGKL